MEETQEEVKYEAVRSAAALAIVGIGALAIGVGVSKLVNAVAEKRYVRFLDKKIEESKLNK